MEEELKKEIEKLYQEDWEHGLKKLASKRYKHPVYRAILIESLYDIAKTDPKKLEYLSGIVEKDVYLRDVDKAMFLERMERARSKLEYVV